MGERWELCISSAGETGWGREWLQLAGPLSWGTLQRTGPGTQFLRARGRFAEGNLEVTFLAGSSVEYAAGQFCRENSTGSLRAAERVSRISQSDPKPGGDPSLPARPGRKGLSRGRRALPRVARFPRVVRAAPPGPRLPLPLRPLELRDFYFRFP